MLIKQSTLNVRKNFALVCDFDILRQLEISGVEMKKAAYFFWVLVSVVGASIHPTTINVPSDEATIQEALDTAENGDTVLVAPGIYTGDGNRDIDFGGKSVVLMSTMGADSTIIDCQGSQSEEHRAFYFHNGEDSSTLIHGFTIQNGYIYGTEGGYSLGGGILCIGSSPRFSHCVIQHNSVHYPGYPLGGGAYCDSLSSPSFINCSFISNASNPESGGGVYCCGPTTTFIDCVFKNNWAGYDGAGGAIRVGGGESLIVTNCTFEGNNGDGGAAICGWERLSSATITNSLFISNEVEEGGAIVNLNCDSWLIKYCTFTKNINQATSSYYRGIIQTSGSIQLENCIVADNYGSGFVFEGDTLQDEVSIACCDFIDNRFSTFYFNYVGIPDQTGLNGNISSDPRFCNPDSGDFSLAANSPCLPGNNSCNQLMGAVSDTCGPIFRVWYVDTTGNDTTGDGSMSKPFATIQKGVNAAASGDTIIIKNGIYEGVGNRDIVIRYKSLFIEGEGGFENVIVDVQDSATNGFNMSCAGCLTDDTVWIRGITISGASWGVYCNTPDLIILDSCRLDANVIGAGCDNSGVRMRYHLCKVCNNADYGIYSYLSYGSTEDCLIDSCLFEENGTAIFGTFHAIDDTLRGGSIAIEGYRQNYANDNILDGCVFEGISDTIIISAARTIITASEISNNSGLIAKIYDDRHLTLSECNIHHNTGEGIDITEWGEYGSSVTMTNCLYTDNAEGINFSRSLNGGTAVTIINSTFAYNSNDAIRICHPPGGDRVQIQKSVIAFNAGYGLVLSQGDSVECCDVFGNVQGNYDTTGVPDQTGINGNFSEAPQFCYPDTGNYFLYDTSPCAPENNSCLVLIGALGVNCINSPPTIPLPLHPINDTCTGTQPVLWIQNSSDIEGEALTYDFVCVVDTMFGELDSVVGYGILEGEDSTGWQVTEILHENWHYIWFVRAFDGYKYSEWTDSSYMCSFFVDNTAEPPSAPEALFPPDTDGSPVWDMLTEFWWSSSSDPDPNDTILYKLEIATDSAFNFVYVVDSIDSNHFILEDSLNFNTHYWWRVTAFDRTAMSTISHNTPDFWTWTLGDVDKSHAVNIADVVFMVDFLFKGGTPPSPYFIGDVDGSCVVNVADLSFLICYLFKGGEEPRVGCAYERKFLLKASEKENHRGIY